MKAILLLSHLAYAQESSGETWDDSVVVREDKPSPPGSGRSVDQEALAAMPGRSADELLRAMPGLHMSAHGGRGKAYQYYLRGFDAVHGGDVAVDVEGVPLNELSNPHAHGYLDLNLMPTLLLRRLDLSPGPTRPDVGDFGVAGSASFSLGLAEEGGQARLGVGSDRSAQMSLAYRPPGRSSGNFALAEVNLGQGVGSARSWRQARLAAGVEGALGSAQARAWVLAYGADFESPGVLREDELDQGIVPFYGAYQGSGGGASERVLAGAEISSGSGDRAWRVQAWGGARHLRLDQNFTGWYRNPEMGDGSRQEVHSASAGLRARGAWTPQGPWSLQGGVDLRSEQLRRQSASITPSGSLWGSLPQETGRHLQGGAWTQAAWRRGPWTLEPALRAEILYVQGEQGQAWAPALAPKLALQRSQGPLRAHLSYGRGYRSTDLAAAEEGARLPLSTVDAGELGLRAQLSPSLSLRGALFGSLVSREVVFDHVQARYLAGGASERVGLDSGVRWQALDSLALEVDLSLSHGRYRLSHAPIPYAPRALLSASLQALALPLGPGLWSGTLRFWGLGARPLPGGFASPPTGLVDLKLQLRPERAPAWAWGLEVDNLLGTEQRDGVFVYASHWDPDQARSELPVHHFSAGAPRALRLSLSRSF